MDWMAGSRCEDSGLQNARARVCLVLKIRAAAEVSEKEKFHAYWLAFFGNRK